MQICIARSDRLGDLLTIRTCLRTRKICNLFFLMNIWNHRNSSLSRSCLSLSLHCRVIWNNFHSLLQTTSSKEQQSVQRPKLSTTRKNSEQARNRQTWRRKRSSVGPMSSPAAQYSNPLRENVTKFWLQLHHFLMIWTHCGCICVENFLDIFQLITLA